ncbi:MAG: hypothetical protein QMB11_02170, partial [Nonlabens sp.]|uniref:hypothetical protein n=1 Tax=Nonlabens sp. TaxID=1888209 RepID=UPI0035A6907C
STAIIIYIYFMLQVEFPVLGQLHFLRVLLLGLFFRQLELAILAGAYRAQMVIIMSTDASTSAA